MMNKSLSAALLSVCIAVSTPHYLQAQCDNFNISHSYLGGNVTGTPWAGVLNSGILTTGDANTTNPGKLTIASANGFWENSGNSGPYLYNLITGDFIADLEVTSSTTPCCNDVGILARPANLADAGPGEDNILVRYFAPANFNSIRSTDNGSSGNTNQTQLYRFLRLVRTGDVFSCYYKNLVTDAWIQMTGSPFTRNDFNGLPLQVGIAQATFTPTVGTGVFEVISIAPGLLTSGINFSGTSYNSTTINWTAGNGTQRAVFMKQTSTGSASPVNTTAYSASTTFGNGAQIGSTGWYCVYNGTGNSVSVSGLSANTTYGVMVVEYFGITGFECYNSTSTSGNTGYLTTSPCPIVTGSLASTLNVTCFNGTNGSASVSASGGSSFTYNWAPSGGNSAVATGLAVGTYTCTITNDCGSTAAVSVTITQPSAIWGWIGHGDVSCFGGSNANAGISVGGGTGPYSYNWTPGNPTGDGTANVFGLAAGTWSCTVTDANSCTLTVTTVITQPALLSTSVAAQTNVSCFGGSNGTAAVAVSGGTTSYSYDWTPGNPGGDGTSSVSGLTAGTWTCTVTDANSCVTTQTFNITAPSALAASSSVSSILCNGGNAIVTVAGSGGTSPYTGTGTFTVTAGTYTYTVTDANGCTNNTTITVTQPTALAASSSATSILCNGGSSTVTVTGSGGTAPYTGTGTFTVTAGTYTYTVTDANGCTNSTSITVTQPTALAASSSATAILCNGGTTTVTVTGSGGTSPYIGAGTFTVSAGTYSYTVTDANGCTATTSITVAEPTVLAASSSATSITCNGGTATVTVTGSGGTSPYTGTGTFTVTAGTYTYTVTDANSCTSTTTITVTEPTALASSSSATSILCNGGNATVTVVGTGGTAPYSGDGTFTVTAGTYSYTVTDANGCTSTTTITITEPSAISTSVVAVNVDCNGNSTGSIDLTVSGGTAPYTFDWNSGTYTTEDLTNIPAGTYSGVLTDANGCTDGGTIVISEPAVLVASLTTATDPTTCAGTDGSIDIAVSGGTIGYAYLWSNAATTEDLSGIGAGTYNCTVTDANGCTATANASLNDPNAPTVTLLLTTDTLCSTDAALTLTGESPAGGTFSGPGVTGGTFDPAVAGVGMHIIAYTYTDINGCTGSTSDSIYVDVCTGASPFSSLTTPFSIYPNPNNGSFTLQLNSTSAADVMIYDAQGKLVHTQKVQPNVATQMNIEPSGIYLVTAVTSDGVRTIKRVIVNE